MAKNYFLKRAALFISLIIGSVVWSQTTYNYTGSIQTYVVPPGVFSISIDATGAAGGMGGTALMTPGAPGKGAQIVGSFSVTPGQVLNILVGEEGSDAQHVGGGGGGSFVWDNATDALLIAAGAGGGGGKRTSGDLSNINGMDASTGEAGTNGNGFSDGGGTAGNGGTAPSAINWASGGAGWNTSGNNGTTHGCTFNSTGGQRPLDGGSGGIGGGDASSSANGGFGGGGGGNARCGAVGGGGGGGYSGGGSGGEIVTTNFSGGGGGGSFNAGTDQVNTAGIGTGNGVVIITELCTSLSTTVSSDTVCFGDEVILHAESTGTGTVSWDGGITDSVAFVPPLGASTYTATSTDSEDCEFSITIFVGDYPTVDAGADVNICEGDSALVYGAGTATDWSWDGGITDSTYFTPSAGTTTYTLTGTIDSTGCMATDMVDVTYNVVDSTTTVSGVTLTATQAGATYQWIACPALTDVPGATNQSFVPTQDGSYAVIIDLNGCVDTSDCKTIAGVGINENGNLDLNIYPNPTQGDFTLQLSEITDGTVAIYTIDGKLIHSETINAKSSVELSLENMEAGQYIVEVKTENQTYSLSLIKE